MTFQLPVLVIHAELKDLLPPLSESEYAGLEADILKRGCLSPIVVWNAAIVDGHNRYEICQKHGIPFEVKPLEFASLDDAMFWVWTHQENRRNLTPYQRAKIALRFKPLIEAKAKVNMSAGGGDQKSEEAKSGLTNLSNPIKEMNTRSELARIADVSEGNIARVEFLEKHADDATKEKLCKGETTINREYKRAKEDTAQTEIEATPKKNVPCIEELNYVHRTTLKDIRQDKPDHLLRNLASHFRKGFIADLILEGMDFLHEYEGEKATSPIIKELNKRYFKTKRKSSKQQMIKNKTPENTTFSH